MKKIWGALALWLGVAALSAHKLIQAKGAVTSHEQAFEALLYSGRGRDAEGVTA